MQIDYLQLQGGGSILRMSDYTFDKWLRGKRQERGWTGPELAAKSGVSKQVISNIERQAPHPVTSAPYRPKVETVDKLAEALGGPMAEAREAAGFSGRTIKSDAPADLEVERLSRYFKELPRDCQLDVLALTEALWRRRRAEGRIEKGAGRHKVRVDYPDEGRPERRRRPA